MAKKSKPVKKVTPAKGATKKVTPKKVAAKKSTAKKSLVKKVAANKAVSKPASPAGKKPVAKKAVAKKPLVKKAVSKKSPVKKVSTANKTAPKRKAVKPPSTAIQLPDATVEKAANINTGMVLPGEGQQGLEKDPITAFDQHVFNKVTTKGEPHISMEHNSKPKNTIRPSGKKPLWRK